MEKQKIIPVVVAAITDGERWLFIRRKKGDYIGYLALIGGKIEFGEELHKAIIREIGEETGIWIKEKAQKIKAIVNERLVEKNEIVRQFLIFVFEIRISDNRTAKKRHEGELEWFSKEEIEEMKERFIPSDYYMLNLIWNNEEKIKVTEIIMEQKNKNLEIIKLKEY